MTDFLNEAQKLLRDKQSVEQREIELPMKLAAEQARAAEQKRLARTMGHDPTSGVAPTISGLSAHERKNYSLCALLKAQMHQMQGVRGATLERDVSWSLEKDLGVTATHGGYLVPFQLRPTMSGLDTKSNAAGNYLVQHKVGDIIDSLRQQARILQLGGRLLTGLRYSQTFPVESSIMAGSWVDENGGTDLSESTPSFGARTMTPHSLQATTSLSRNLLLQANADLESWIRDRIGKAHALALDAAALNGGAVSSQPQGLLKVSGIGSVSVGVDGGAPALDHILALEDTVGAANASDNCSFLTTSTMRKKLRKLLVIANGGLPLWEGDQMLGHPAFISAQVPSTLSKGSNVGDCHACIYGDFTTIILGEFLGALEVLVDVYAEKKRGNVQICSFGMYDVLCSQPPALAAVQDFRNV